MGQPVALPLTEPRQGGWKKLILALAAFVFVPAIPQFRAMLPVADSMLVFVPAMAVCSLLGWWAGGRAFSAVLWVALAVMFSRQPAAITGDAATFGNLVRGWALLLAGCFGIVCFVAAPRPFFVKALLALAATIVIALTMLLAGSVSLDGASQVISAEFARRNAEFLAFVTSNPQWKELSRSFPSLSTLPENAAQQLAAISKTGLVLFPALLALQSLAGLGLAWATYHRLSRQRVGAPLAPLRDFRFNDQLVWGLIAGLVILVLPSLGSIRGLGQNLVLFFGALYAMRGLGVLAWFMAPGVFAASLAVGFVLLFAPVLQFFAFFGFLTLGITALGLGVGDTWADWRSRARSTLS